MTLALSTMTVVGSRIYSWFVRFLMILRNSDPEIIELMSGVIGVLWGLQLLNPTAVTFDGGRGWAAMQATAPEEIWGTLYLAGGILQILVLLVMPKQVRGATAFCAALSWALVSLMIWYANPISTGVVTYGVIAAGQVWAFWRVALEAP